MKPGDAVWYLTGGGANRGEYRGLDLEADFHLVAPIFSNVPTYGSDYVKPEDLFTTERAAIEALIERQTKAYAQQTQQHNDLIARLSKRLEAL